MQRRRIKKNDEDNQYVTKRQNQLILKIQTYLIKKALFQEKREENNLYNIVRNVVLSEVYRERPVKRETIAEDLSRTFLEERLSTNPKKSIWAPLKQASMQTFTAANNVIKTAKEKKSQLVKGHREPFGRMAIIARSQRNIDIKTWSTTLNSR